MDSTITEFDIPSWHALEGYINGIDRTAWEINAQNVYFGDDKRREDTYQQNGGYGPQGGYPQAPQGVCSTVAVSVSSRLWWSAGLRICRVWL